MTPILRCQILRWLTTAALCLAAASPAAAQRVMKLSAPSADDAVHAWMKAFKTAVEAREGRRIRIELFPAGQQGSIAATIEAVQLGTLEAAAAPAGILSGLDHRFQVLDYPGIFVDFAHAQRTLADPDAVRMLSGFGAGKGVETLLALPLSPVVVVSTRPIHNVADFKGLKLRVLAGTPMFVETAKRLGASPVSMPLAEVQPALRDGAIDAALIGFDVATAKSRLEPPTMILRLPGAIVPVGVIANTRFLKSLGAQAQRAVREEAVRAAISSASATLQPVDDTKKASAAGGVEVVELAAGEAGLYRERVGWALPQLLGDTPSLKADYERLLAIAVRRISE